MKIKLKWVCVDVGYQEYFDTRTDRLNFGNFNTPMFENSFGIDELPKTYERRMRKFYE